MKVSELTGTDLDYWVAKAHDLNPLIIADVCTVMMKPFQPHKDWLRGGQIIEAQKIAVYPSGMDGWEAYVDDDEEETHLEANGDTPLIAAMRALLLYRYGETVETN